MNGMLSAHIAQFNAGFLETVERKLESYAGGAAALAVMEDRITRPIESLNELVAQYDALHRLGAVCRMVESELEDYYETAYCSDGELNGPPSVHEESICHIGIRDLLDERFAYVRAIYSDGIMTF